MQFKKKSFPHFEELCIIFGVDRANGREANFYDDVKEELARGH